MSSAWPGVNVSVAGVFSHKGSEVYHYILFGSADGQKFRIWIGGNEAQYVQRELDGAGEFGSSPIDSLCECLSVLGQPNEVRIDGVSEGKYIARLIVQSELQMIELRIRPADAVCVAIRLKVPIRVYSGLLKNYDSKGYPID